MKGKFLVIEGLDGSGASTQIQLLQKHLIGKGKKVFVTKEPTDNVAGGLVRGVLTGAVKFPPDGLQLLFAADRAHHVERFIKPALESGAWVICDRYLWSSVAFGSIDMDRGWLWDIQKNFLLPDLSIFLQVAPNVCIERIHATRFEVELFEQEAKLAKVWQTYEWLHAQHPKETVIVNGEGSVEEVQERIWQIIGEI